MPSTYLDGRELADRLGESYETVMGWARSGRIPRIETGRRIMFDLDRVIDALRASQRTREPVGIVPEIVM